MIGVEIPSRGNGGIFFPLSLHFHRLWGPPSLPWRVKHPERGADHSSQSSAEVRNAWSYSSTQLVRLHGTVLN